MLPFAFPATDVASPFAAMRSSHPCLRVPDYDAAVEWYRRAFDFRVVMEWPGPDDLRLAYLAAPGDNGSLIEIIGGPTTDGGVPVGDFWDTLGPARYHHFAFSVPSHAGAMAALAGRGIEMLQEPFLVPELGYCVAFLAEPWGNLIELVELGADPAVTRAAAVAGSHG